MKITFGLIFLLTITSCARFGKMKEAEWQAALRTDLQYQVDVVGRDGKGVIEGEKVGSPGDLVVFYKKRGYKPAWVDGMKPSSQVADLIEMIKLADGEGLSAAAYHLATLERLGLALKEHEGRKESVPLMSRYEALLSDAYLTYGGHLSYGRLNPRAINPDWAVTRTGVKMPETLTLAIDKKEVKKSLEGLPPQKDGYKDLKTAYARFREISAKGGWPSIPLGLPLKAGMKDMRVPALRARLAMEGFLGDAKGGDEYDTGVANAIAGYQSAHGLKSTGVLDKTTVYSLNVPVGDRLRDLQVNLERWRWLPRDLGERYVFVDIANFTLTVFEKGKPVMSMPVVVGKDTQNTPVFDDQIMYVVLNPSWNIPNSIVANEIAPKMVKDPTYIAKKGMEVFKISGNEKTPVPVESIDWTKVTEENFGYLVSQPPGPKNPLGAIKFLFPNEFAVYLHGTPETRTFKKNTRAESHGCIRVEKPLELAQYLLKSTDGFWSDEKLMKTIKDAKEKTLRLKEPVDVHLFYWTAWIDDAHRLNFRPDVYGWDHSVLTALQRATATRRVAE